MNLTEWREGYDYPSDDDDVYEYDIMEEADRAYEQQNDKIKIFNTWTKQFLTASYTARKPMQVRPKHGETL